MAATTMEVKEVKETDPVTTTSSSSTTKTRKTVITYETESNSSLDSSYRPHVQARNIVIQRTGLQYGAAPGRGSVAERSISYSTAMVPASGYANLSNKGVTEMTVSRQKEKKDMQDLNERLANYIEKVRFFEAQNRRMADDLLKLKERWGKETEMIKAMYEAELAEARRLLDDAVKEKSRLEIRLTSNEEYMDELKQRLDAALKDAADSRDRADRNIQQLSDYEGEIALLRRRLESLEGDRDKEKAQIKRLQDALTAARSDLDNETLLHIDAENRRQTLEEELQFLKAVHEQELKELQAMAYRDTTSENREYWKNEMGQALREIQQAYDDKLDGMRGELEGYYKLKVQELNTGALRQNLDNTHTKEETKRLKSQLGMHRDKMADLESRCAQLQRELDALRREKEDRERDLEGENLELKGDVAKLRAEMEAMLKELEHIVDTKLGLELEIAAYRKLLEGEESRDGLRQIVDSIVSGNTRESLRDVSYDPTFRSSQVTKGEMQAKTSYQKSAKGPVAIAECGSDGKFIALDNTGRKDEDLTGWKLTRNFDGTDKPEFVFPQGTILPASAKLRIWAKGSRPADAPATDLEYTEDNWGVGSNVVTKLVNLALEDRATHVQKTNYA
jgi:intermediate filament protein if